MKVALFGGTGFVGNYIVDELLKQGYEINILVREGSEHKLSKNKYRILKGSTEFIFHLNSIGHIENMEKFNNGFLEYNAEITIYKKYVNKYFPRKIIIEDYSKKNHWKIIIFLIWQLMIIIKVFIKHLLIY